MSRYAGLILAGGDGTRLSAFTRRLTGDDRPKQFCRLIGDETLLEQTRRRARRLIDPERLVTVVTRHHERFYRPASAAGADPRSLVEQPSNRGTAPAILYGLSRLAHVAPGGPVVMLPSDHYVSDDEAFMARVECALETVESRPESVVLLGIAPDRPETEYGWIEPADLLLGGGPCPVYRVRRFWEKPELPVARRLEQAGCLWNSFVIVAQPAAFDAMIRRAVPELHDAFAAIRARLGTLWEQDAARAVYGRLQPVDLSRQVLQPSTGALAVLPVSGVEWSDLGDAARVRVVQQRIGGELVSA